MKRSILIILTLILVPIMGLIAFTWLKGITGQVITLEGENIALVCDDVRFQISYSSNTLYISNTGNIKIYQIKALINQEIIDSKDFLENWPVNGLDIGEAFSGPANFDPNARKIKIIPTLIGETNDKETETYTCREMYGKEISLD